MAGITTDSADDACRKVLSLRAVVFTMSNLTTVLTSLVFIVSKGSVERRKLSKLVTLELVLAFGDRSSLWGKKESVSIGCIDIDVGDREEETYSFNDIVDELLRLVDFFFGICHDQTVKIFLLVTGVSCIRATLALFHGALATNGNLGTRVILHFL